MYKADSKIAEEFIDHQEILDTLEYAHNNKSNRALIEQLIDKAAQFKGLSHREAALLLECDQPDLTERIFRLAQEIKHKFYGNRIVMFAPLYLSNYCVNGCVYCPYHLKNKTIARKKLTQEEIRKEVRRACEEYAPNGHFIPCITYGGPGCLFPHVDSIIDDEIEKYNKEVYGIH